MKKIIREVNEKLGIHQITIADERWYMKSVTNLVNGLPEFRPVPSVTWITQSYPKGIAYFKWLAEHGWDEAEAIKNAAGDKGTKVHAAIEAIFRQEEVRIDSKFLNKSTDQMEELTLEECDAILAFLAWKKSMELNYTVQTLTWEKTVFSDKYEYAGTVDWIVKFTNKLDGAVEYWVIDFKTSQYLWPSHELQLNAYKGTIENGENPIEGLDATNFKMAILQLGYRRNKNGYKFTEIVPDFDMFLTTQKIWRKEHGDEQPHKRDYPIVLSPALKVEDILAEVKPKKKK